MTDKCVAGCQKFYGEEIRHHQDCHFYPSSLSKMADDLNRQYKGLLQMAANQSSTVIEQMKMMEKMAAVLAAATSPDHSASCAFSGVPLGECPDCMNLTVDMAEEVLEEYRKMMEDK